jgi:hypothetical protein
MNSGKKDFILAFFSIQMCPKYIFFKKHTSYLNTFVTYFTNFLYNMAENQTFFVWEGGGHLNGRLKKKSLRKPKPNCRPWPFAIENLSQFDLRTAPYLEGLPTRVTEGRHAPTGLVAVASRGCRWPTGVG